MVKIDKTDLMVLDILKKNAKLTTSEISKAVRKPITTVHNRIKKLVKEGIIKNYTVIIDHKKIGNPINAFVLVNAEYKFIDGDYKNQEEIARAIKDLPEVEESCIVTGTTDIVIRTRHKDIDSLNNFLVHKLRKIQGVAKTQTAIILKDLT